MTGDLVQFLRDQLAKDERVAQQAGGKAWAWEQHHGDMCNDPTCPYGELATDEAVLMSVHGYDVKDDWQGAAHIARHNPARTLLEVEAKRQLLDEHQDVNDGSCGTCVDSKWGYPTHGGSSPQRWPCTTLRLLALPYADHPDYRAEWALDRA